MAFTTALWGYSGVSLQPQRVTPLMLVHLKIIDELGGVETEWNGEK